MIHPGCWYYRAAAVSITFPEPGDFVDAEHVIDLKRQWSEGHFLKAKALITLQEYEKVRDVVA